MKIYVQFSDQASTQIVSVFASPQDPDVFANYGEVDDSDARWGIYYTSLDAVTRVRLPAPTNASG